MAGIVSWRMSSVWFDLCREFDLCVAVHCAILLKSKMIGEGGRVWMRA
jgi:hypothetical protein